MKKRVISVILATTIITMLLPFFTIQRTQAALTEATITEAYRVYYDVLKKTVDEYGVWRGNYYDYSEDELPMGVVGAELIDFDNDGLTELVYVLNDGNGRWLDNYIYGYANGAVLYSSKGDVQSGAGLSGTEISLKESLDKKVYLVDDSYEYEDWTFINEDYNSVTNYFSVKDEKWISMLSLTRNADPVKWELGVTEWVEWYVNGIPVSEQIYANAPQKELGIVKERKFPDDPNTVYAVLAELEARLKQSQSSDMQEQLLGEWSGTYTNNIGINGLDLSVFKEGEIYRAIFNFYPVKESPAEQRTGSYYTDIEFNRSTGMITITGTTWIDRPIGNNGLIWIFANLSGIINGDTFSGVVTGIPNATFTLSRVTLSSPSISTIPNPHSAWATPELERAIELQLIPDSLSQPNVDYRNPITRAEFAAVSVRVFETLSRVNAIPAINNPFTDTNDVEVLKAYSVGITTGTSATTFSPYTLLNREQAATMLTRVFKRVTLQGWTIQNDSQFTLLYSKPAPFADDLYISDWAKDSVYFMASNGIIQGVGNNSFAPRATTNAQQAANYATTTREQALAIAVRMVENLEQ